MIRLAVLFTPALLLAQAQTAPPAQALRGEKIFFETAKGATCSTCHALAGRGTPAGPDLMRLARIPPRAIAMAIRSTRTQYVQTVKLKTDETFPGMRVKQDEKVAEYYDLGKTPPVLRKLERTEIVSATDNATWKHPPESAGYTSGELADLIGYLRWVSHKDRSAVNPDDLE